jgi:hypothetical protein
VEGAAFFIHAFRTMTGLDDLLESCGGKPGRFVYEIED